MMELLIIGAGLFVIYSITGARRAAEASRLTSVPSTLRQTVYGRGALNPGEPNSQSPIDLTAQARMQPASTIAPPVSSDLIPSGLTPPGLSNSGGVMELGGSGGLATVPPVSDSIVNGVDQFQTHGGIAPSAGGVDVVIQNGPGYQIFQRPNGDTYQVWTQ